ncbi:hypothetical protein GF327_01840 [Candidatus Woesearchaeota archaeon]|nr:hypothetical protein [Candidatus Woesearchaeota archaeon]
MSQINTSWNLDLLKKGNSFPKKRKTIEKNNYDFINKWRKRDDYLKDPGTLKKALFEYEKIMREHGTGGDEDFYYSLKERLNQNNPDIKAKVKKINDFSIKIANDLEFFLLRISKIPTDKQERFLSFPDLNEYHHFLKRLFEESKHLLSEKEEIIMNLKSNPAYANWVKTVSMFLSKEVKDVLDEDGKIKKKNFSEILSLLNSRNKKTRDSAAGAFNEILKKHSDIAEAEINSVLENKKIDDELRGFERPDSARHISDDVETKVIDNLVELVVKKFSISKRYYRLKSKLTNVKKLKYHERNVPIGKIEKEYGFTESVDLVNKVFSDLDPEFSEIFNNFLENGQIDAFPKKAKTSGAFCSANLLSQPTFVLLNHTDKLHDVTTLAHEMGHAINYELMRKKQNALNFGTVLSTAETASTFMEDFVLRKVMKKADDELKLSILMKKLNNDISTIFRQIACYKFEQELHKKFRKKGYLSKKEIGDLFSDHMDAYMGDYIEQSSGSKNWWVYWSHIRYFFYNYSYAFGLLISKSLQNAVKKDPDFIGKVKEFLSAGTSDSPKNIMRNLGIDISDKSFWENGLDEIEELLEETEILAKDMGKV